MTRTGSRCPVWRCLECGSSEPGEPVLGVWDLEPGEPVLGVWDSEPGEPALGVWDSEPVWALAGKASIPPRAATLSKRQYLRKADWCN